MGFTFHSGYSEPLDQIELARSAESLGLHGMTLSDHLFIPKQSDTPYPYSTDGKPAFSPLTPWPDALAMTAALGVATTTMKFFTNVYILPLRHPLMTAKSAATAAIVSGGRLVLGVGVGWMREEFDTLGAPFTKRGRATDEIIPILRRLWSSGRHDEYHSDLFDFPSLTMLPVPHCDIPIFVGGDSEAALERTARLGDGYMSRPHAIDDTAELIADLEGRLRAHDRDPAQFHFRGAVKGPVTYDVVARLAELGARSIHVRLWDDNESSLQRKRDKLAEFADGVVHPYQSAFS